jgi:uncharacterized protein YjiS (DUF1127 family)/AraC-like DNA-binding protein
MSHLSVQPLLDTETATIRDVVCGGECRHRSAEECARATHLVFPYRGVYVRHLGRNDTVAEANQVLFFNATESYRVSHPVEGGDACLSLSIAESVLRELAPKAQVHEGGALAFRRQRRRIDPRAQALVAVLRHGLNRKAAETLEAETLALTLVRRALGERTSHAAGASAGRQKLVDRAKLVLSADLARRWTLAEIAAEVGVSPVYLTQVFQQVEGIPLYRYQLQPFQRRLPAGLRPPAGGVPALRPSALTVPAWIAEHSAERRRSARTRRSLKILTAAAVAEWSSLSARMSGLPRRWNHDRENLCRLRLRAGCQRHQGKDRRKHGGSVLRRMRASAERGRCLDVRQDRQQGGLSMSRVRAPLSLGFNGVESGATGGFGALAKKVGSDVCAWLGQCQAGAAERRALSRLTDWELHDIGISRAEAGAEIEKWFWRP